MNNLRSLDQETYRVEFSPVPKLPDYVTRLSGNAETVKGEIPAACFGEFIRFTEAAGAKIYECSLKRATLEDAFFETLEKGE
jgi:hypothetical protein